MVYKKFIGPPGGGRDLDDSRYTPLGEIPKKLGINPGKNVRKEDPKKVIRRVGGSGNFKKT